MARVHPGQKLDFQLSDEERAAITERRLRKPSFRQTERLLYPIVAVIVVVIAILAVIAFYPAPQSHQPSTAPNFVLPSSDGGSLRLLDHSGKVILLDFMDPDCPSCQTETLTVLLPLYAAYGDRVVFISVDTGIVGPDTMEDIFDFKEFYGAMWTYVLDDGTVHQKYGVDATPYTFIINKDMTIRKSFRGETDYGTLASTLDAALEG